MKSTCVIAAMGLAASCFSGSVVAQLNPTIPDLQNSTTQFRSDSAQAVHRETIGDVASVLSVRVSENSSMVDPNVNQTRVSFGQSIRNDATGAESFREADGCLLQGAYLENTKTSSVLNVVVNVSGCLDSYGYIYDPVSGTSQPWNFPASVAVSMTLSNPLDSAKWAGTYRGASKITKAMLVYHCSTESFSPAVGRISIDGTTGSSISEAAFGSTACTEKSRLPAEN